MSKNNRGGYSPPQMPSLDKVVEPVVESLPALEKLDLEAEPKFDLSSAEPVVEPVVQAALVLEVDSFQEAVKAQGFKSPELLVSNLGPAPTKRQKFEVLSYIDKHINTPQGVLVESIIENGDYPSRIRRHIGEQFRIEKAEDFSFRWMKLVIKE